jgi:hypothetical protein
MSTSKQQTKGNEMIISTYEEALAAIGTPSAEIEVVIFDRTIKPTDNLRAPVVGYSRVEGAILDRSAHILFE